MPKSDDDSLCQRCGLALGELLDGRDDTPFVREIRERVESNPVCRACFESYKKTAELCRQAFSPAMPSALGDRLTTFLREQCKGAEGDD